MHSKLASSGFHFDKRERGLSLLEMIIVIAITGVLCFLLMSVFSQSILKYRKAACAGNLRTIAAACELWSAEHQGHILPGDDQLLRFGTSRSWYVNLSPYLGTPPPALAPVLISPGNPKRERSYNINNHIRANSRGLTPKKLAITTPSRLLFFGNSTATESHWLRPSNYDKIPRDWFGDGSANFLFLDGHVESIRVEDLLPPNGSRQEAFTAGLP